MKRLRSTRVECRWKARKFLTQTHKQRMIRFSDIEVGDLIIIEKDKRVPADVVLMRTTEKTGACFIRTDQLDGETDWKLRIAMPYTQNLAEEIVTKELFAY